ncbi:major facilitator superfamily domain-containing protein [Syncephalastrum racemosum]|uniref:Major facilitator superfamily domain-containing protein n=1 Tax=Syncephalastrum racemosum TaxID=13706 RepID=A0A1X2GZM7_SYNRA|nr:major facilitator superfamily domain-containing protein [Syncephalastrum racemosum]
MEPATRQETRQTMQSMTRQVTKQSTLSMALAETYDEDLHKQQRQHQHPEEDVEKRTVCEEKEADIKEKEDINEAFEAPKLKWYQRTVFDRNGRASQGPGSYTTFQKSMILAIVSVAGAISPLASTLYYPALLTMQEDLHTTDTNMNASLSIFTFFTAFFPLLWASIGDKFGRRPVYLISFMISVVGSICCAESVNIGMFIAFRGFSAIGSSSVMSMGAGTIADIFEPRERGRAFSYYTCGPLLGPALGPIIGGYMTQGLGWRSNFWFLTIFAFCVWLGILFFLPETNLKPKVQIVPVDPQAAAEGGEKPVTPKKPRFNPLSALELLQYKNIIFVVTFIGVLFFDFYLVSTTFSRIYENQYGLSTGTTGLCFLPLAFGSIVGGLAGGRLSDRIYSKNVAKADGEIYPEMRINLVVFWVSLAIQLCAFVAFGWCLEENVHFSVGLVCIFFLGLSLMVPNVTLSAYLVDCFRKRSASVTACNNFVRYIMAGVGSLISSDMQRGMGNGPLFTFCGAVLILFGVNIIIVKRKGPKWSMARQEKGIC